MEQQQIGTIELAFGRGKYTLERCMYDSAASDLIKNQDEFLKFVHEKNGVRKISLRIYNSDDEFSDDELICGMYATISNKELQIVLLAVDESYRGKGVGSLAMHKIEEFAESQGVTLIFVITLDFQAKSFYEKFGYSEDFTVKNYLVYPHCNDRNQADMIFLSKDIELKVDDIDKQILRKKHEYRIECDFGKDEKMLNWINKTIEAYDLPFTCAKLPKEYEVSFSIEDCSDRFVAGIHAESYRGILETYDMWIDDNYEGLGFEEELINTIEDFAKEKNLRRIDVFTNIHSDVFSKYFVEYGYTVVCKNMSYKYHYKELVKNRLEGDETVDETTSNQKELV